MAKGDQRTEKLAKKPKKDTSAPKAPVASDRPMAPMTSVLPKGKLKNKPAYPRQVPRPPTGRVAQTKARQPHTASAGPFGPSTHPSDSDIQFS